MVHHCVIVQSSSHYCSIDPNLEGVIVNYSDYIISTLLFKLTNKNLKELRLKHEYILYISIQHSNYLRYQIILLHQKIQKNVDMLNMQGKGQTTAAIPCRLRSRHWFVVCEYHILREQAWLEIEKLSDKKMYTSLQIIVTVKLVKLPYSFIILQFHITENWKRNFI